MQADEEWRRLLRGGFGFETAPFATHPIDRRRAEHMYYIATVTRVSDSEIMEEAKVYLLDQCKINIEQLDKELYRVLEFLKRHKLNGKTKKAWLLFWNDVSTPVENSTLKLIQAFDPRVSDQRICEFIELYYRSSEYSFREILYFSTRSGKNPYRCKQNISPEGRFLSCTCGHTPWLEARFCHDILVWSVDGEGEKVSWSTDSLTTHRDFGTID